MKEVGSDPVGARPWLGGGERHVTLSQRSGELLSIGPRRSYWIAGGVVALLAAFLLVCVGYDFLSSRSEPPKLNVGLAFFLAIPAVGIPLLLLLIPSCSFDTRQGRFSYGFRLRRRSRPISDIHAVQICSGGIVSPVSQGKSGSRHKRGYELFQLNLVLKDESKERINLVQNKDRQWILKAGEKLSAS